MPEESIVCDTGPLIALSLIDHLELLQRLYSRVLVPGAVFDEVEAGTSDRAGARAILGAEWLEKVESVTADPLLATELGAGEAAVIAAAYAMSSHSVLLDDRKARRVAFQAYKLRVRGSAGVLVAAKRAGLIPAVRPLLDEMMSKGYYLSVRLVDRATSEAGETSRR
jgi:predicted nucleic acid-binding protein